MTTKTKPAETVAAFKAFDSGMTCRGFQFQVDKTYEHEGRVVICSSGFHAVTVPFDAWNYYARSTTFARVTMGGETATHGEDSKIVAARITIDASLTLPEWIRAQADAVVGLCRAAKKSLASKGGECAAATGDRGHAAATGHSGHAAATGDRGHAAATGDSGHAAATGHSGHAAATGHSGHAAATGDSGHAAATGYSGHAAATGDRGHAAATGHSGHAAATGDSGHAAATGDRGYAAVEGKNAIAASLGIAGAAMAKEGGAISLAAYDDDYSLVAVRSSLVGQNGVEAGKTYRLTAAGDFEEVGH